MPILEYDANGYVVPPIGLDLLEQSPNDKANEAVRFEWSDAVGNKVKKDVVVFKHGKVEEFLCWKASVKDVLTKQKVVSPTDVIAAYHRVLGNPAQNNYNNAVTTAKRAEDARIKTINDNGGTKSSNYAKAHLAGLKAIEAQIFPDKAYAAQRTWLQLTLRKPLEMTIRSFVVRVETINNYLPSFPTVSGQMAQMLSDMELKELIWRAIPRKWQVRLQDKRVRSATKFLETNLWPRLRPFKPLKCKLVCLTLKAKRG